MKNDVLGNFVLGFMWLHILYHVTKEPICGAESNCRNLRPEFSIIRAHEKGMSKNVEVD